MKLVTGYMKKHKKLLISITTGTVMALYWPDITVEFSKITVIFNL